MGDYIERGGIMSRIAAEALKWGEDYDADQILGDIEDFPAADVRPVVLGEWVETEMYYDDYAWVCCVCGEPWTLIDGTPAENNMNFCPNCGADMVTNRNQLEEGEG